MVYTEHHEEKSSESHTEPENSTSYRDLFGNPTEIGEILVIVSKRDHEQQRCIEAPKSIIQCELVPAICETEALFSPEVDGAI